MVTAVMRMGMGTETAALIDGNKNKLQNVSGSAVPQQQNQSKAAPGAGECCLVQKAQPAKKPKGGPKFSGSSSGLLISSNLLRQAAQETESQNGVSWKGS